MLQRPRRLRLRSYWQFGQWTRLQPAGDRPSAVPRGEPRLSDSVSNGAYSEPMNHHDDQEQLIEDARTKQRNTFWPDAMVNSGSVDALLWRG